ncbi:MAG TPA: sensor histidine kinase [Vicinamibacterales bacterium]|nr:sensor histidine kinase [Vicinamibacterales bacterium]
MRPLAHVTIRTALIVGFGLTLGLWLFAGYQVTQRVSAEQREAAETNARYVSAQELLASIRGQVLVVSVVVGDALLDPDPQMPSHRQDVQRLFRAIDGSLAEYVPVVDEKIELLRIAALHEEVAEFRRASEAVLSFDGPPSQWDGPLRLRRLMPKREAAIRASDDLQAFNRAAFIEVQRAVSQRQAEMQRQLWKIFGIALFIGLTIAWFASRHATRLEHRLVEQRAREAEVSADLQRLSARLVQVQEDEQRRIARELHDEVGQALSAVKVELTVAERRLERLQGTSDLLADAHSSADGALRSVRDLTHLLHPSALDDLGLVSALASQVREFRRRHSVAMAFVNEGSDDRPHPEVERAIYRVVQEALTNIARHSRARSGRVRLAIGTPTIRVVVEDDGIGFDPAEVERPGRRRGLGLLGMRERVTQLRGRLHIDSAPTRGTRIEAALPRVERPSSIDDVPDERVVSALLSHQSNPEVDRE